MAHAIWSGAISFGLVTIPVKLYSAIREHELHFNYLHRKDEGRIRYERVCSVCGERVPWNEIARGYELQKGEHVILEEEDFARASPEATQSVDIVEFVRLEEIDPVLFDVPYYLAPEKKGRHAYALLRDTLASTGTVGIARVVMRTREHLAALKPRGPAMVIEMMHWADEVVAPSDLEFPDENVKLSQPEKKMATALVGSMTTRFEAGQFEDHYRDQLMRVIEQRAEGKPVPRGKVRPRAATNVVDLVDVLQKSLASARKPHGRRRRAA